MLGLALSTWHAIQSNKFSDTAIGIRLCSLCTLKFDAEIVREPWHRFGSIYSRSSNIILNWREINRYHTIDSIHFYQLDLLLVVAYWCVWCAIPSSPGNFSRSQAEPLNETNGTKPMAEKAYFHLMEMNMPALWIVEHIEIMFDYTGTCCWCCSFRWCWLLLIRTKHTNIFARRIRWKQERNKNQNFSPSGWMFDNMFSALPMENCEQIKKQCARAHIVWSPNVFICIFYSWQRICIFLQQFRYLPVPKKKTPTIQTDEMNEWMLRRSARAKKKSLTYSRIFDPIYDAIRLLCVYIFFSVLFTSILAISHPFHTTAVIYSIYRGTPVGRFFPVHFRVWLKLMHMLLFNVQYLLFSVCSALLSGE